LYDLQTGTERLVSTTFGTSQGANAGSDLRTSSADGRFIVYRSSATDLLASPTTNNVPELYYSTKSAG